MAGESELAMNAAKAIRAKRHSLGYGFITTPEEDAEIIQREVVDKLTRKVKHEFSEVDIRRAVEHLRNVRVEPKR